MLLESPTNLLLLIFLRHQQMHAGRTRLFLHDLRLGRLQCDGHLIPQHVRELLGRTPPELVDQRLQLAIERRAKAATRWIRRDVRLSSRR